MNFEGSNPIEKKNQELEQKKALESFYGKYLKCFKRWVKVGVLVGAAFVAGEVVKNAEDSISYNSHISSSLSLEQLKQKETNDIEIGKIFGISTVHEINIADRQAYLKRQRERKDPIIIGFQDMGFAKYMITEKYGVYPKGWINGQIDKVQFINTVKKFSENQADLGTFDKNKNTIYFYVNDDEKRKYGENILPVDEETISHELGHANDWNSDIDLNILDRQYELLGVYNRLMSSDAYDKDNPKSEYLLYLHGYQQGGSKFGLFMAASEYWAQICSEYFTNPEGFLKNHPNDFKLVDTYVKKNDPSFDIFSKDRGAFDSNTGQIRDIYK